MKHLHAFILLPLFGIAQAPPFNSSPEFLDKNKVRAAIVTVNNKFRDFQTDQPSYEVPKGSGVHAQIANSLWIGGMDAQNTLHVAGNTYRQSGADFFPGPLDTANIAAYTFSNTAKYNRLWKVDCDDINGFVSAFNSGAVAASTYTVPDGILNYPASGSGNFTRIMAAFHDANGDGAYSPLTDGDYPLIRGHQQILSIYNDQLFAHTETMGPSMGLEIRERAYAFSDPAVPDSMQAINYTTFYDFEIYNRSANNYYNVYISDWADTDVGYYLNDLIGTDSANHFTYTYNSGTYDPTMMGMYGYGSRLPVVSHALMRTDCSADGIDNNHNQAVDEPGEHFLLDRSTYYNNNVGSFPPATTNPASAQHYYDYMKGGWKDGTPFTYGGNAYGGTVPAPFVYPGLPPANAGWTEGSAGNTPGDRRIFTTSGPFNFPAGAKIHWGFAIVFSQDTTAGVNSISQFSSRVRRDVRVIRQYHDQHLAQQCAPAIITGIPAHAAFANEARLYPNPARDVINLNLLFPCEATVTVRDILGRKMISFTCAPTSEQAINVSALPKGVYLLLVENEKEKLVKKFVKE